MPAPAMLALPLMSVTMLSNASLIPTLSAKRRIGSVCAALCASRSSRIRRPKRKWRSLGTENCRPASFSGSAMLMPSPAGE